MRNTKFNIPDFEAICEYFIKSIEHGADIVVHSHGTTIGGLVINEELARWLESRDDILWVSYPGLESYSSSLKMPKNICGMDLNVFGFLMLMLEPHSLMLYKLQLASHLTYVGDASYDTSTHQQFNGRENNYPQE
ncbi:hypothetical protein C1646_765726 [Rhizophagus diaphanus]|nr:hypothetical protein C1646_765726 [Rhizophagus diaphanus] [Rhizophagus sp. MUCL 43196]